MSTELSIKLWTKNNDPVKNFTEVLRTMEQEGKMYGKWGSLTVKHTLTDETFIKMRKDDGLEIADLLLKLQKINADTDSIYISVTNAMEVWRFEGADAVQGYVPIWIEAWGNGFFERNGVRPEIEGHVKLNFANSGPFVGIIENEGSEVVQRTNNYIAENLESATELMFSLINSDLGVEKLKCFTDAGTYHPLNAHLTYWQTPQSIIDDLLFVKEIWDNGLKAYNVKPLKNYMLNRNKFDYHEWRTEEMREILYEKLSKVINNADQLNENWPASIDWDLYDTYDSDSGTMLLNYPLWLNGFIDDFYLDVLSSAGK